MAPDPAARAGYSGRSAAQKMGIRPGASVGLLGAPDGWRPEGSPEGVAYTAGSAGPDAEVVILFARSAAALRAEVPEAAAALGRRSSLWIAWPRRAAGHQSDLTEQTIRDVALPLGLVDVKVAALEAGWSGLKLVWRLQNRAGKA